MEFGIWWGWVGQISFSGWAELVFRVNEFLKLRVLVTRRVSEEPAKILANVSGYHLKGRLNL